MTLPCCGGFTDGNHGEHTSTCAATSHINRAEFFSRLRVTDNGCHEWGGYVRMDGYGQFMRNYQAHRIAVLLARGPIPKGAHVDHLCCNRVCANPEHLEVVTPAENNRRISERGRHGNAAKTHCPRGHKYDDANTYVEGGRRHCRTCDSVVKDRYKRMARVEQRLMRREMESLERLLMRRNAVRSCEPARPAFDVWRAAVQRRLDELDAGDRAWDSYSSNDGLGMKP